MFIVMRRSSRTRLPLSAALFLLAWTAYGETPPTSSSPVPVNSSTGRVVAYKLESVELIGTDRISKESIVDELELTTDRPLNDDLVMNTRQRLLGLGLFKSAILIMRKGSKPGYARLVIQVEDDESVLTTWGLGGEVGFVFSENAAEQADVKNSPMGYRLDLVGRNLLNDQHRGNIGMDIDGDGFLRQGNLAYGFPRFADEDVQFDAEVTAVDVSRRYLNAMGFGVKMQGIWTQSFGENSDWQFGPAMYMNRGSRFRVPAFPDSLPGPKIGYVRETRLHSFFPSSGSLIAASVLVPPTQANYTVLDLNLANTINFSRYLAVTVDGHVVAVGAAGLSVRGETRFDTPLNALSSGDEHAMLFLRLRAGGDRFEETRMSGSAAILGIRYHSSAFIAELAFQVTRSPQDLSKEVDKSAEGPR